MKILVIHEPGPLGQHLLNRLRETSLDVTPLLISQPADVALDELSSWIPGDCDLVLNALSMDDPELAERQPEAARHRLSAIPQVLAERAARDGIAMFQFSSCYIFDGRKQRPYIASNPGQPLGVMGQYQWECEQMLRTTLPRHLILRTGWSLRRFCEKVTRQVQPGEPLHLTGRCRGQPVAVWDQARVVVAIAQQLDCGAEAWGTYQYAGSETVSQYQLGLEIVEMLEREVQPVLVDETAPWMELEPANAVLNCQKIRHTFGIQQQSWRHSLPEELGWPRQHNNNDQEQLTP